MALWRVTDLEVSDFFFVWFCVIASRNVLRNIVTQHHSNHTIFSRREQQFNFYADAFEISNLRGTAVSSCSSTKTQILEFFETYHWLHPWVFKTMFSTLWHWWTAACLMWRCPNWIPTGIISFEVVMAAAKFFVPDNCFMWKNLYLLDAGKPRYVVLLLQNVLFCVWFSCFPKIHNEMRPMVLQGPESYCFGLCTW